MNETKTYIFYFCDKHIYVLVYEQKRYIFSRLQKNIYMFYPKNEQEIFVFKIDF